MRQRRRVGQSALTRHPKRLRSHESNVYANAYGNRSLAWRQLLTPSSKWRLEPQLKLYVQAGVNSNKMDTGGAGGSVSFQPHRLQEMTLLIEILIWRENDNSQEGFVFIPRDWVGIHIHKGPWEWLRINFSAVEMKWAKKK